MKGWSFRGLVEALGTAAFKNLGASVGNVPLVGDSGLLSTLGTAAVGFDFSTYKFKNSETVHIAPPYTGWPFGNHGRKDISYVLTVDAAWSGGDGCSIKLSAKDSNTLVAIRDSNGTWTTKIPILVRTLERESLNSLSSELAIGLWVQNFDANIPQDGSYPTTQAGTLEVYPGTYGVAQKYTAYSSGRTFNRQKSGVGDDSWRPWLEDLKTNTGQDCTLGSTSVKGLSFRVVGDVAGQDTYLSKLDKDTLQIAWGSGTSQSSTKRVHNSGGVYSANAVFAGWRDIYEGRARAPFNVEETSASPSAWLPMSSQTLKNAVGSYNASVTTGIKSYGDRYPNWMLDWALASGANVQLSISPDGNLEYFGGGQWPNKVFASQKYVNDVVSSAESELNTQINTSCVRDVALGVYQEVAVWLGPGYKDQHPWVITAVSNPNSNESVDTVGRRPLYKHYQSRGWVVFSQI